MRHVVAVAQVADRQAREPAPPLAHREQVRERLTRMLEVRQRVDHGHRRRPRQDLQPLLLEGPQHDRRRRIGTAPGRCPRSSPRGRAEARSRQSTTGLSAASTPPRPRTRRGCASTASRTSSRPSARGEVPRRVRRVAPSRRRGVAAAPPSSSARDVVDRKVVPGHGAESSGWPKGPRTVRIRPAERRPGCSSRRIQPARSVGPESAAKVAPRSPRPPGPPPRR